MRKSCTFRSLLVFMVLALFVSSPALAQNGCKEEVLKPQVSRETAPDATDEELQALVDGNTAFALDLYQALRGMEENQGESLFFSPYSISLALAMAYAGARGETEQQMAKAIQFTLPQERTHPAFDVLDLAITSREQEGIELNRSSWQNWPPNMPETRMEYTFEIIDAFRNVDMYGLASIPLRSWTDVYTDRHVQRQQVQARFSYGY